MKRSMILMVTAFMAMAFSISAIANVESLRGNSALDADANKVMKHRVEVTQGGVKRNFKKQPPVIPHKTEKYRISLRNNGCLKCHSEKAYKKEKAPRIGDSHYIDRDGKVLKTMSSRRYFCTQCHVTQVKADELVENTYESGK
ncbi:MAG: nitrate reductase cytochrome c-type subunit [Pseudomonadota bacterium]